MFLNMNKKITCLSIILLMNLIPAQLRSNLKAITNEDEFICLIDQSEPTIVMGTMEACPHCKIITPIFEDQSKKNKNISFVKANGLAINMHGVVKRESKGKGDFKIIGYPSFVFIKDKKIDSVLVGGSRESLEKAIKEFNKKIVVNKNKQKNYK